MSDRDDWLEWRGRGIGASDIGALLGLSRWQSPWSLWAQKVGLLTPDATTERQQLGHDFEPVIAKLFTRKTGLHVAGEQTWCQHPDEPWMRCTADGFVFDGPVEDMMMDAALGGFEAKTDGRFGWPDGVPANYLAGVQWSMAVTGLARWWIAVLFAGWRFEVFEVERDQADIDFMVKRARTFWHDCVVPGNPPPTDGSDATLAAIASVYSEPLPGSAVDFYEDTAAEYKAWIDAKAAAAAAQLVAQEAAAVLTATLGDAEEGRIDGEPVVSWRSQTRKAHMVEESTFRVLRPVKPKKENARVHSSP